MAHIFRVRLDANGESAAAVEAVFATATEAVETAFVVLYESPIVENVMYGPQLSVVQQVIEMDDNEPEGVFRYRGRRILAPNISPFLAAAGPDPVLDATA